MTTKVWVDISQDAVRMVQYTETPDGRRVLLPNGEIRFLKRFESLPPDALTIIHEPVELLDELLRAGYRPSDNKWAGGHVKALEAHISFAEKVATALLGKT